MSHVASDKSAFSKAVLEHLRIILAKNANPNIHVDGYSRSQPPSIVPVKVLVHEEGFAIPRIETISAEVAAGYFRHESNTAALQVWISVPDGEAERIGGTVYAADVPGVKAIFSRVHKEAGLPGMSPVKILENEFFDTPLEIAPGETLSADETWDKQSRNDKNSSHLRYVLQFDQSDQPKILAAVNKILEELKRGTEKQ